MSEATPAPAADPVTPEPIAPSSPPPPPAARSSNGLPSWLPFFLLAAVPALIVGLAVYFLADGGSGGGSNTSAAAVLDGFFRSNPSPDEEITSVEGERPVGFPADFPVYPGSNQVAGFTIKSAQGTQYFVISESTAGAQEVYEYFVKALDEDPWQVEIGGSGTTFTGVQFSRPDDADIQGQVTVHHSDLNNRTAMYVSFQDLSSAGKAPEPKDFVLKKNLPLPGGFPTDVTLYKGQKSDTTVTDTYFERGAGSTQYVVSFITKDTQDQVLKFYRDDFQRRGWTVREADDSATSIGALGIEFEDSAKQELQGAIQTDTFDQDSSYTKVDLVVQVSSTRGRGN